MIVEDVTRFRPLFNSRIIRRPSAIVRCVDVHTVAEAVNYAASEALAISIRGGGHNVGGSCIAEGGMLIDLHQMNRVMVDPINRIARVQGGALYRDLDIAAARYGLATTGGAFSTTGVAGLTLGGGVGWLMGKYGLACDNLLAITIVDAKGQVRRVDDKSEPDVIWAVRGGGAISAVVVEMELSLHPLRSVFGGRIGFQIDTAPIVLESLQKAFENTPDELTVSPVYSFDNFGNVIFGIDVCALQMSCNTQDFLTHIKMAGEVIEDRMAEWSYPSWQSAFDNQERIGLRSSWKSAFLVEADLADYELLHRAFLRAPSKNSIFFFEPLHGAAIQPRLPSCWSMRPNCFQVLMTANWKSIVNDDVNLTWLLNSRTEIAGKFGIMANVNYMDDDEIGSYERYPFGKKVYDKIFSILDALDPGRHFYLGHFPRYLKI